MIDALPIGKAIKGFACTYDVPLDKKLVMVMVEHLMPNSAQSTLASIWI